jgi:hypothetical protein
MLMWVNCGLPATSPIAQTPGAVVCSRSLTLMVAGYREIAETKGFFGCGGLQPSELYRGAL